MLYTTLILASIIAVDAEPPVRSADAVTWQDSYRTACKAGVDQSKPLAVFIGTGPMAWKEFVTEGKASDKATRALAKNYVCVYIDRETPAGKRLAEQFGAATDAGLVISTRDGNGQAFFHTGKISASDLESRVEKYAGTEVVTSTESLNDSRASFSYDPSSAARTLQGSTGLPGTMGSYPGTFQGGIGGPVTGGYPANFGTFGGYAPARSYGGGGSCPNCR